MEEENAALRRTLVVIPALEPDGSLPEYVSRLLALGAEQVLAVDDGSGEASREVFAALEAMDGCTVLRHPRNLGKGRAMKTAFDYILSRPEWQGMGTVTADADGQHRAEDVCAVAAALAFGGDALVLGVRDLTLDTVPTRSKIGNRVTSWAFHTLYGVRLEDTQTGLRGIPWERLAWCAAVSGDRYEYEMNVLIRAARDRVALKQVPIQVVYFDNNAGSHLRTVRDAWRVACVLISGLGFYTLCSCFSALTDVLMFWLGSSVLFAALPDAVCYWWATATARALSSAVDYTLNHIYFGGKFGRRSMARYYCLWACQMLCSYGLLMAVHTVFPALPPVIGKAGVDILLALVSYQIQLHWVFREGNVHGTR